jgi:ribose transport system permease protein
MGHIDLSVPWTIAASAMLATAIGGPEAIPVGLAIGALVGLFNGLGVAFLRVPSMIFTLGVNTVLRGLMVMLTGGFSPTTMATPPMQFLAKTEVLGIPMAVFVWALLSLGIVFLLTRTPMGRYIYAIGNKEAAAYLSGVNTRLVILGSFVLCGLCSALAGILLAGYSSKAYQAMGDPYLLPAIAAVVIGGTNILGGQGRYAGTVVGTILIVLLQSVLSVMQMPEAGRQIIYGLVIILMLVLYGRGRSAT